VSSEAPAAPLSFWDDVGANFPSLKGAPSTGYYFECERLLFEGFGPKLRDLVVLKTDLWDEAKNTEILRWVAEQGARPAGVDVSLDIVRAARSVLAAHRPGFVGGDVRELPIRSGSVDVVYSMGTIEHFPEYAEAVREIFRVLRPGGLAIVGVPNKLDPFLRPLLVHTLNACGLYGYGMEKSFTPKALQRLLESAGFRVTARTGILFIPGWLRMLDLWLHTRSPRLTALTAGPVRLFAWLYRRIPAVRRHGYLTVCVAERPA
jgi:ubiquinone/menaquinone biosynthesis C-methylase UbiE